MNKTNLKPLLGGTHAASFFEETFGSETKKPLSSRETISEKSSKIQEGKCGESKD